MFSNTNAYYTESKLRAVRSSMPMLMLSLHELPVYERDVVSRSVIPGIPSSGPQPPYACSSRWNTSGLYVACPCRAMVMLAVGATGEKGRREGGEKGRRDRTHLARSRAPARAVALAVVVAVAEAAGALGRRRAARCLFVLVLRVPLDVSHEATTTTEQEKSEEGRRREERKGRGGGTDDGACAAVPAGERVGGGAARRGVGRGDGVELADAPADVEPAVGLFTHESCRRAL